MTSRSPAAAPAANAGGSDVPILASLRQRLVPASATYRAVLAAVCGVLAVAALPPFHLWPVLVPAFVGLAWLKDAARSRWGAFAAGWFFGFGFFIAGLYWVANAFFVRGGLLAWAGPPTVVGLAVLLAVFPGIATLAVHGLRVSGIGRVLVFAAAWTAAEWLRGVVLTGFPWNLVGSAWSASPGMIQVASAIGVHGLGLITVVAATLPAALAEPGVPSRRAWASIAAAWLAIAILWAGGEGRLAAAGPTQAVEGVWLRLVQPNIDQRVKWRPDLRDAHIDRQIRMSRLPADRPPTHVIWAETAAPLYLATDPLRLARVATAAPPGGLALVGAPRRTPPSEPLKVWNSFHAIDGVGRIVATYDKAHLVPFGEYVPLQSRLPFGKLTEGTTGFTAGPGLRTLAVDGLPPFGTLICYEVIFPGRVADRRTRPAWLLNLTNDAWYGHSTGPHQHLAAVRMRAVEEGLPIIRATNTGISAIIDSYGRTVERLDLGRRGVIDGPLPRSRPPTPYARLGDWALLFLLLSTVAAGLTLPWNGRHRVVQ